MGNHDSYSDIALLVQRSKSVNCTLDLITRRELVKKLSVHAEPVEAFIGFFRRIQKGASPCQL